MVVERAAEGSGRREGPGLTTRGMGGNASGVPLEGRGVGQRRAEGPTELAVGDAGAAALAMRGGQRLGEKVVAHTAHGRELGGGSGGLHG